MKNEETIWEFDSKKGLAIEHNRVKKTKYWSEYGKNGEYIRFINGTIVKKENAQKFIDQITEEAFLKDL